MAGQAQSIRQVVNIDREWKYKQGDYKGAEKINYDDVGWDRIGLPHSFSAPYFLCTDFYVGYGWYRKALRIPQSYTGKRISLEFEAAFQDAEVFVNGHKAGEHKGGYTGFSMDITPYAIIGNNVVAVRVNNNWNPQLAPRAGGYVFSGGIYRDVHLVITDPVHVAWYGTFITTPQVSPQSASVRIQTAIENQSTSSKNIRLQTAIIDPKGKTVAIVNDTKTIAAGDSIIFDQITPSLKSPSLWSPETPVLYKAISRVYDGEKQKDEYTTTFGIRSVKWTADSGLFINNKHYYLHGVDAHQDHAGWADGVTNAALIRDVQMVKEAGFNFIRASHYPHDPAYSAACDSLGVMLWEENVFWGIGGFKGDGFWDASAYPIHEKDQAGFEASVLQQLTEMIRIHRNHPSIIIWSMSNEPFFTASETMDGLHKLLREEVALAHQLDPTRQAAIGGAQRPLDKNRIDTIGDVAGYNGDGASIPIFQNPGIPNMVTEYGSTTADRPGDYSPGWDVMEDRHDETKTPWRSGRAIWSMFDYGCFAGSFLAKMGIVDYFRIPKRSWYWYRNEQKHIPPPEWPKPGKPAEIKLTADKLKNIKTDGTDDIQLVVHITDASGNIVDAAPDVTLEVVSGPGEFPTGKTITFKKDSDINIVDGQAAIEFRAYYSGNTIVKATSPGLAPAFIELGFIGKFPFIKGKTHQPTQRPYVRYTKKKEDEWQYFGQNNPSFSSSVDPNHATGLAGDGRLATWWQPLASDKNPFWTLDTEKRLLFKKIKINFVEGVYHYKVEASDDNKSWTMVLDNDNNTATETEKVISLDDQKIKGRFLRISFTKITKANLPKIAEVTVEGKVLE